MTRSKTAKWALNRKVRYLRDLARKDPHRFLREWEKRIYSYRMEIARRLNEEARPRVSTQPRESASAIIRHALGLLERIFSETDAMLQSPHYRELKQATERDLSQWFAMCMSRQLSHRMDVRSNAGATRDRGNYYALQRRR